MSDIGSVETNAGLLWNCKHPECIKPKKKVTCCSKCSLCQANSNGGENRASYSSYANQLHWGKASQYDSLCLWCLFLLCIQISWACNAAMLPESSKQQHCSAGDTITVSDGLSDRGVCHHMQEESANWTVSQQLRSSVCCQRDKYCH